MVKESVKTCVSCTSKKIKTIGEIPKSDVFAGKMLEYPPDSGRLIKCDSCKLVFRYPRLKKEELDKLYAKGKEEHWQDITEERYDWKISKSIIQKKTGGNILDIGCFDGKFLSQFSGTHKLFGIEIHKIASEKAKEKGVDIIYDDFEKLSLNKQEFDIATSFDVIEHTHDPFHFLKTVSENITDKGLIIISSGNSSAFSWKLSGARYWYCTINEHISFISPKWAEIAAERLNLDLLEVKKISHKKTTFKRKIIETTANLIYRISPKLYSVTRKKISTKRGLASKLSLNLGVKNTQCNAVTLQRPPSWISSKDHIICVFKKR